MSNCFFQYQQNPKICKKQSYLDLEDILNKQSYQKIDQKDNKYKQKPNLQIESPQKTKLINKESIKKKPPPESFYTKNICFNICQKTIKVISQGYYQEKLNEICNEFDVDSSEFEISIVRKKNQFTGPKALQNFIDQETIQSKIFSIFMKWFLQNKYMRYALKKRDLKNIESYIAYKNEILLNILK